MTHLPNAVAVVCFTSYCQTPLSVKFGQHWQTPFSLTPSTAMSTLRALGQLASISSRVVARPALRSARTVLLSARVVPSTVATRAFSMTPLRFSEGACACLFLRVSGGFAHIS